MSRVVHVYDPPERFVAGTVGPPGERTFFLQARQENRITSVVVEKEQVAVLAERLDAMLDEVLGGSTGGGTASTGGTSGADSAGETAAAARPGPAEVEPAEVEPGEVEPAEPERPADGPAGPEPATDDRPLDQPLMEEFRVATLRLAWDGGSRRVIIEAYDAAAETEGELPPSVTEDPDSDGPETLVVRITAGQARAFARRSRQVVASGRPPCPFCGAPLNPSGHLCPRQNGYLRSR